MVKCRDCNNSVNSYGGLKEIICRLNRSTKLEFNENDLNELGLPNRSFTIPATKIGRCNYFERR